MQEYLPFPVLCWISLEFDLRIQCFSKVMLKFNELKMPFILIWKSSRFWNVRISVEYFIFLSALLVTTSFPFSLFLTFFYLHSGGLILSIRNPDCSVISKKYCSDKSGLSFSNFFFSCFPSCLYFSLILTHLSSAACSVLVLSPVNLDYITSPSPVAFPLPSYFLLPSLHLFPLSLLSWCSFFLSAVFPILLSSLFLLASSLRKSSEICFLHGWECLTSGRCFLCRWECWAGRLKWKLCF